MNIKKELVFGIIGFLVVIGLVLYYVNQYNQQSTSPINNSSNIQVQPTSMETTNNSLTLSEVAKHNTASDCWQIINNSVYNLTEYLVSHPGGARIMIPYCGAEATEAYNNKGNRNQPHSSRADQDLIPLKVGDLSQ